jgi:hypothetical protein
MRLPSLVFYRTLLSLTLLLIFAATPALAQQRGGGRGRANKTIPAQKSQSIERTRQQEAISLLIEAADRARLFEDLFYRARILTNVADALWFYDQSRARGLFRRAWEAATASDMAEREEAARETGALPSSIAVVTEARDEILGKAAARDAKLAESFLQSLTDEKTQSKNANRDQASRSTPWRELSASGARRLSLAFELLNLGNPRRAAEIAAPLINEGVSADLIAFIIRLREKIAGDADALYLRLLQRAAADPQTDANAVLLLSAPILSPSLLVVIDEFGSLQFRALPLRSGESVVQQPAMTQRTQSAFYDLASTVLLRPSPAPEDSVTMQDLISRFYTIGRLLPSFENNSAPYSAFAPALRARHSELFNRIEAGRREQISSQFELNTLSHTGNVDPLRSQTEQLARSEDVLERRRLAFSIVKTAARNKSWDRARRAAAEIENTDERQAALSFIMVQQIKDISHAYRDQKEDDFDAVVQFVRGADVPPFARAWGLAQAASIATRKRDPRISQVISGLMDEAEGHASRVGERTLHRVAAYGVLASIATRIDQPRAWRLMRELVKAANAMEDYTGDEDALEMSAADADSITDEVSHFSVESEVFRLDGIFATMARLDYVQALAEARALDRDVPRALAHIAIARVLLEK